MENNRKPKKEMNAKLHSDGSFNWNKHLELDVWCNVCIQRAL